MDNLKKYLQQHSDELDSDVPEDAVWQRLEQASTPVLLKKNVVKMMWRYAAAACVLVAIATGVVLLNRKQSSVTELASIDTGKQIETITLTQPADTELPTQNKPKTTAQTSVKDAPNTNAEYVNNAPPKHQPQIIKRTITIDPGLLLVQDVERNYTQLVNYQLQRLRATPVYAESPNYFSTFKQQLKQIEADEATIKKDIKLHGLNDDLLQQLININQQKLTVLKDLQTEINKLNNKVKSPETRADSSQAFYLTM